MDPNVWGSKLWFVIHTMALNFPENPTYDDIRNYESFFNNLKFVIPCDKCKIHFAQRLQKKPVINHLKNPDSLFRYTIDIHNDVNKSLGKRIYLYDEVVEIYRKAYNNEPDKTSRYKFLSITNIIILVVIILIIMVILYYKRNYKYRIIKCK
jgi:hypothetical protein